MKLKQCPQTTRKYYAKEVKTLRSKNYNVHQVTVDTEGNSKSMTKGSWLRRGAEIEKKKSAYEKSSNYKRSKETPPPCCLDCV